MNILNISRLEKGRRAFCYKYQTRKDNRNINWYIHFWKRKRRLKRYYNKYIRRNTLDYPSGGWYKKAYNFKYELY